MKLKNNTRALSRVGFLVKPSSLKGHFEYAGIGDDPVGVVAESVPQGKECEIVTIGDAKVYVYTKVRAGDTIRQQQSGDRAPKGSSMPYIDETEYKIVGTALETGRGLVMASVNFGGGSYITYEEGYGDELGNPSEDGMVLSSTAAGVRSWIDLTDTYYTETELQNGTASVHWDNLTDIPDPVINLAGDLTGSVTLTDLGAGPFSLSATIAANSIALGTDTTGNYVATISEGEGINVSGSGSESASVTISAEDATTTNKGVASFNASDFSVSSGAVSLLSECIQDIVGAMVTGNSEYGISVTYQDADGTLDFNVNDPTVQLSGDVTGSAVMTNLGSINITTTIAANSVALGTDTTGNYVATIAAGEGIDVSGSGTETAAVTISAEDASYSNKGVASFSAVDFTVVDGAVSIADESIQDIVGAMVAGNTESGITVAYQDTDGTIDFNVNDPTITLTGHITGAEQMVNLGNTSITTYISVNAITGQSAITSGLASTDELLLNDGGTLKRMDISVIESYMQSNLAFNDYTHPNHTGHVTSSGDGATTLTVSAITGQDNCSALASADEFLVNDGGAIKRVDLSVLQSYMQGNLSSNFDNYGSSYQIPYTNIGDNDSFLYSANLTFDGSTLAVTGAITGTSLNTGQGANELYPMNQAVRTSDSPTFAGATINGNTSITGTLDVNGVADFAGNTNIDSDGDIRSSRDGVAEIEIIALSTLGGVIGTDTDHDLILRRNNIEIQRLTSNGIDITGDLTVGGSGSVDDELSVGGRIVSTGSTIGSISSTTGTAEILHDPTEPRSYLVSYNYSTTTALPLTVSASSIILDASTTIAGDLSFSGGGKVSGALEVDGTFETNDDVTLTGIAPVSGTEMMTITSAGVIGSAAIPSGAGDVTATAYTQYDVAIWDGTTKNLIDTGGDFVYKTSSVGLGTDAPVTKMHIVNTAVTSAGTNAADTLTVESTTNSNINLITDDAGLTSLIFSDTTRAMAFYRYDHSANKTEIQSNGSVRMDIDSSGDTSLYGDLTISRALNTNAVLEFAEDSTVQAIMGWNYAYDGFQIDHQSSFSSAPPIFIGTNNHLSIGARINNSTYPLYVTGDTWFDDDVYIGDLATTSGNANLTIDSNGLIGSGNPSNVKTVVDSTYSASAVLSNTTSLTSAYSYVINNSTYEASSGGDTAYKITIYGKRNYVDSSDTISYGLYLGSTELISFDLTGITSDEPFRLEFMTVPIDNTYSYASLVMVIDNADKTYVKQNVSVAHGTSHNLYIKLQDSGNDTSVYFYQRITEIIKQTV